MNAVRFVQYQSFGAAISLLQKGTPNDYHQILKNLSRDAVVVLGMCKVCKCTRPPPLRFWPPPFDLSRAEKFDYEKL